MSLSRLTRLAVWFMDLGIVPVYSDPSANSLIIVGEATRHSAFISSQLMR